MASLAGEGKTAAKLVRVKPTWMWSHLATLPHDKMLSLHQSICANIPVHGPKCIGALLASFGVIIGSCALNGLININDDTNRALGVPNHRHKRTAVR
jgi:hypothetical protein